MKEHSFSPFPFKAEVVIGETEWLELCERHGLKDSTWMAPEAAGDTGCYGCLAVVRFDNPSAFTPTYKAGICAHEAVHVFSGLCRYIGESSPSEEFTAYQIQAITEWLLKELECSLSQVSTSSSQEQPSSQESSDSTSSEIGEQAAN